MTWTRTPQEYPDRADVLAVSRSARWLLMEMYSWSNAQLTNGRVPRSILRRISDAEDVNQDVAELLREGLLEEPEEGFLLLDWTNQEDAETVQTRAARNADKTKRARERKERHLANDHSMCVAPYCKLGVTLTVTGNATGNKMGNDTGKQKGKPTGKRTGMLTPLQSSPVQSVLKGRTGLDCAGADSAGATSGPASVERLNAAKLPRPAVVTFADLPEVFQRNAEEDGEPRTQEELDRLWLGLYADPASSLYGTWTPADPANVIYPAASADAADAADRVDDLIPAGGAGTQ